MTHTNWAQLGTKQGQSQASGTVGSCGAALRCCGISGSLDYTPRSSPVLPPGLPEQGKDFTHDPASRPSLPLQESPLHSSAAQARTPGVPLAPHIPFPQLLAHPQVLSILLPRKLSNMPLVLHLHPCTTTSASPRSPYPSSSPPSTPTSAHKALQGSVLTRLHSARPCSPHSPALPTDSPPASTCPPALGSSKPL